MSCFVCSPFISRLLSRRLFGTTGYCAACNKVIPAFEMVMRARTNVYHLECFACQQCNHRCVITSASEMVLFPSLQLTAERRREFPSSSELTQHATFSSNIGTEGRGEE